MYNAIHYHSDAEVRTKATPETTEPTSARSVAASEWRRLRSSELIESEKVLRRLRTVLLGVIERIDWVVPCTRRNLRGSREWGHILIGVGRLIEDDAIWTHILLPAKGVAEVVRRIDQILWWVAA